MKHMKRQLPRPGQTVKFWAPRLVEPHRPRFFLPFNPSQRPALYCTV